jgi:hypothetical protein
MDCTCTEQALDGITTISQINPIYEKYQFEYEVIVCSLIP